MSVNFFNSSGTDLDSLFYTNNGNAGAIGFKTASGQDLGNRYTNASNLGYAIGYKNSAGTDIGFLRGKAVPPTISSHWANIVRTYINRNTHTDNTSGGDNDNYTDTDHQREVSVYLTCGLNGGGNGSSVHQVDICALAGSRTINCLLCVWDNRDLTQGNSGTWSGYTNRVSDTITANSEGGHIRVTSNNCNLQPRRNFSVHVRGSWTDRAQGQNTNVPLGIRIFQHFYSNYGDAGWVSNDIWFG